MVAAFDVSQIDDVVHGRVRLGILTYLAQAEAADFTELRDALQTTQGNLSIHLRKLEDAGYVTIDKSFLNRKPLTRARLTKSGRKALADYLDAMAKLVDDNAALRKPARSRD
jgi:DNA-binding MarR family transcriptional regulator